MARVPRIGGAPEPPRREERPAGKGDAPSHFCPGCGRQQQAFLRYPWYFCQQCLAEAEDGEGRRLVFGNASMSGGLVWSYADDLSTQDDRALCVRCLIRGRPVTVGEARFGGVVAEPVNSETEHIRTHGDKTVILTAGSDLEMARARLRPVGARP